MKTHEQHPLPPANTNIAKRDCTIDKYLDNYAAQETAELAHFPHQHTYDRCLVIPAYNEDDAFISRLKNTAFDVKILLILVLNQPQHDEDMVGSVELKQRVIDSGKQVWQQQHLSLICHSDLHILLVERFTKDLRIPTKMGVGLARKIGCDIAVSLYRSYQIKSSWIYCADADTHLPKNYFDNLDRHINNDSNRENLSKVNLSDLSCAVFDFYHLSNCAANADINRATQDYENAIKYYRDSLRWAGSPYAFCTLGSTLCISTVHYCRVRGFPKRAGAEDFYLLNKLAKTGSVVEVPGIRIGIDSRISSRVPFGTGPAVAGILSIQGNGGNYNYYNPEIFLELKTLLATLETLWNNLHTGSTNIETLTGNLNISAAKAIGIDKFLQHASKQCKTKATFDKHFHDWFDAFRTLKFIHYLQKNEHPNLPLSTCLKQARTLPNYSRLGADV